MVSEVSVTPDVRDPRYVLTRKVFIFLAKKRCFKTKNWVFHIAFPNFKSILRTCNDLTEEIAV